MSLVSIIIATYNREDYIIETLESIKLQTYTKWECIIVDDSSTDNSEEKVRAFIQDDFRFLYVKRPPELKRGANTCRNFGYTLSSGVYIKFFDSDDLMLSNHLEVLVSEIEKNNLDFVVGDCQNFDDNGLLERPYEIDREQSILSPSNFARLNVAWITNDLLVKRSYAEKLKFNEKIKDVASEYQYNIKLLLLTLNGKLINQILSLRRIHNKSMTSYLHDDVLYFYQHIYELKLETLKYINDLAPLDLKKWFLSGFVQYGFKIALMNRWPGKVFDSFCYLAKFFSFFKALLYLPALSLGLTLKKGYSLITYIRK
tara:strand:- start:10107 stop:11048 length:942 start_codon:yes stop_codon:yes gene_type:complete